MQDNGSLSNLIKGVGVEIGVWHGDGAIAILNKPIARVYLVDPYDKAEEFKDCELKPSRFNEGYDLAILTAVRKVYKWSERAFFVFARSIEAAKTIEDDLDFVYIDANHNYEYVKQDIEAWYPKLKKGGILSGHDYPTLSVQKAVDEFVKSHKLKLIETIPDWYCYKP